MEFTRITRDNLADEHICCAISNNNDIQVSSKKAWMESRFDDGLVFLKGDVRGKCFIEYIPAEYAWAPIDADGYMYIDCLWVSGKFKGQGYSSELLGRCIDDSKAKGKKGLVILSSEKKRGFLADHKYLEYKGFETVDTAEPYFELMYLPFDKDSEKPCFRNIVKSTVYPEMGDGFTIFYSSQCPFTAKYIPLLEAVAEKEGASLRTIHIGELQDAQNVPCPFTAFALYHDGEFVTHEIQSEKKFEKIIKAGR